MYPQRQAQHFSKNVQQLCWVSQKMSSTFMHRLSVILECVECKDGADWAQLCKMTEIDRIRQRKDLVLL